MDGYSDQTWMDGHSDQTWMDGHSDQTWMDGHSDQTWMATAPGQESSDQPQNTRESCKSQFSALFGHVMYCSLLCSTALC